MKNKSWVVINDNNNYDVYLDGHWNATFCKEHDADAYSKFLNSKNEPFNEELGDRFGDECTKESAEAMWFYLLDKELANDFLELYFDRKDGE